MATFEPATDPPPVHSSWASSPDLAANARAGAASRQTRWMYGLGLGVGVLNLVLATSVVLATPQTAPSTAWLAVAGLAALALVAVATGIWVLRNHIPVEAVLLWRLRFMVSAFGVLGCWLLYFAAMRQTPQAPMLTAILPAMGVATLFLPLLHWFPGALSLGVAGGVAFWGLAGFPPPGALPAVWILSAGAFGILLALVFAASLLSRWIANLAETAATARRDLASLRARLSGSEPRVDPESDQCLGLKRELTLARDAADQAIRAKTEFLATMSHEIRTPLNGILPILELMQATPLNAEQREYLGTAFLSSRHLLRLINDILDFAKVEAGKLELESIEFSLRELAEAVTDLIRRSAQSKGLELVVNVDSNVPSLVRGDPIRLRQVLTNLVSNAVKFTESGGVRVEVKRQRLRRKDVELLFAVIDTGAGMSQETTRRLFQAFTQADASTTRRYGGTGLGLVICKRLVELMGGKIGLRSTLGKGSTFWFVLPLRRSLHDLPSLRRDLAGVRALTLFETSSERERVSAMLRAWGVIEERAEDAHSAIGKLNSAAALGDSQAFELLLVDSRGQEPGVQALLREIRAEPRLKSIQILIAASPTGQDHDWQSASNVAVVEAPLQKERLKVHLDRLLDVAEEADWPTRKGRAGLLQEQVDASARSGPAAEEQAAPAPGRVLLVEDNSINLAVARKLLERLGMECMVAKNGHEALGRWEREAPVDLILMDIQMPGIDGYDTTRRIRRREDATQRRRTPIVAMTANAMQGDRERCLQAGMDDYVAKPIELSKLRMTLVRWLGRVGRAGEPAAGSRSIQPVRLRDDIEIDLATDVNAPRGAGNSPSAASTESNLASSSVLHDETVKASARATPGTLAPSPAAEPSSVDAVIDMRVLADLRDLLNEEFVGVVRTYIRNTPSQIVQLDEAARAGDIAAMVRPAHSLKSSSANVGAMQVADLAREIEVCARESRRTSAAAALPALREAFAQAAMALTQHVTRVS